METVRRNGVCTTDLIKSLADTVSILCWEVSRLKKWQYLPHVATENLSRDCGERHCLAHSPSQVILSSECLKLISAEKELQGKWELQSVDSVTQYGPAASKRPAAEIVRVKRNSVVYIYNCARACVCVCVCVCVCALARVSSPIASGD